MPTILIIDDDINNAELLHSYLELYGFDTLIAETGQDGFEMARLSQPDLIFTDLRMPIHTWDGYKVTEMLKTDPYTQHIPVVAVTASGDYVRARECGCDDIILRPFRTNELLQTLERYIGVAE